MKHALERLRKALTFRTNFVTVNKADLRLLLDDWERLDAQVRLEPDYAECERCNGDCSDANPPVTACPVRDDNGNVLGVSVGYRTELEAPAQAAPKCCTPTDAELQLLRNGDYTPEELWGGREPSCPKCAEPAPAQDELIPRNQAIAEAFREGIEWQRTRPEQTELAEALRPIHSMILNALDRDAEEGKTARGEMASELRAALAAKGANI